MNFEGEIAYLNPANLSQPIETGRITLILFLYR